MVGITGTNGKTTVSLLLAAVLESAGRHTGVIGTLSGARTTPEAPDLQRRLAQLRDEGCAAVAMEVSSHALAQHRVDATRFAVGVFTNLTRDHLDYHGSMEEYFRAKARLFEPGRCAVAVVNLDDAHGRLLLDAATVPTVGYSLEQAEGLSVGLTRCSFRWRGEAVELPLGGRFNVSNAIAAAEAARQLGVSDAEVAAGLSRARPADGRFQVVPGPQPFTVLVDYAHTPDGLQRVLEAARDALADARGRVLVVFGCGGDRDVTKRPLMGRVAEQLADVVVVTSDNPRSERPSAIAAEIVAGMHQPAAAVLELDRRAAISRVIGAAHPGDVVVIAGKGHETQQIEGDRVTPFDDRQVAAELLAAWEGTPA